MKIIILKKILSFCLRLLEESSFLHSHFFCSWIWIVPILDCPGMNTTICIGGWVSASNRDSLHVDVNGKANISSFRSNLLCVPIEILISHKCLCIITNILSNHIDSKKLTEFIDSIFLHLSLVCSQICC